MQRVTYPVLCNIQSDDKLLSDSYRKIIKMSAFIIFPLMTGLSALAEPFVIIILGYKWSLCATMLQILCFALMWYPIHAININLLLVKGRSDLNLRLEIIKKIMGVTILCIAVPMGIMILCYSRIISSIFSLIINTHYTGKLINLGFMHQMKDLAPTFLISVGMWTFILAFNVFLDNMLLKMLCGIIIGALFYITMSYFFNRKELLSFISLIRR